MKMTALEKVLLFHCNILQEKAEYQVEVCNIKYNILNKIISIC